MRSNPELKPPKFQTVLRGIRVFLIIVFSWVSVMNASEGNERFPKESFKKTNADDQQVWQPLKISSPWIWGAEDGPGDTWMCFRQTVKLESVPEVVPVFLAVDGLYWLWINGKSVVDQGGLKRGPTPTGTYADRLDLAPFLKPGSNEIAVLVWYYGISSSSHMDSGKGGFLMDALIPELCTSHSWRVRKHPGYSSLSKDAKPWKPLRFSVSKERMLPPPAGSVDVLSESSVRFDARLDEPDWITAKPGEDWKAAVVKGLPPVEPWGEVVERPIPLFKTSEPQLYENAAKLELPRKGPVELVAKLPANLQVLPRLKIRAEEGREIVIHVERSLRSTTYITRSGEQEFEVPVWGNGEFVSYSIPEGVIVLALDYRESGFDTEWAGYFTCNDKGLNVLWNKCIRSVYVNMRETHMDCPDRERSGWPADMADAGVVSYYAFDRKADTLLVKMFREFIAWRTKAGILWGAVPSGRFKGQYREFPCQNLQVIAIAMPEHVMQTGDMALAAQILEPVRKYLIGCWQMDNNGLPSPRPTTTSWGAGTGTWMDHSGNLDRRLFETVWYFWALDSLKHMYEMVGQVPDLEVQGRLESIRDSFDRVFWDDSVAAYRSPGFKSSPDDRGNAIAVCAGLSKTERYPALSEFLIQSTKTTKTTPYTERYPVDALFLLGRPEEALNRLRERYATEIAHPYTTLPEQFGYSKIPGAGSWNHAYGAVPAAILVRRVAGIEPTSPGYETFTVQPAPGGLKSLSARVPTVKGDVAMSWEEDEFTGRLQVTCPPGTRANVVFPSTQPWLTIKASGGDKDPNNPCRFSVGPGQWSFVATNQKANLKPKDNNR